MNGSGDKTKNQHYVPQMYLRNFCFEKDNIYALNVQTKRIKPIGINNLASETYFYDLPREIAKVAEVDEQVVEKFFSKVEGQAKPIFNKIIKASQLSVLSKPESLRFIEIFSDEEKIIMAYYILFQNLRTRYARDLIVDIMDKSDDFDSDNELKEGLKKELHTLGHAVVMFNEERNVNLVRSLLGYTWSVGVCTAGHSLYTSDHPVVIYSHQRRQPSLGLVAPGVEITLPINNNLILILRDGNFFEQMYLINDIDNRFASIPPHLVQHYNYLQVYMAKLWLFCHENTFDKALQWLKHLDKTRLNGELDEEYIRAKLGETIEKN